MVKTGVNKSTFVCPFQDRQFQNPDRLTDSFRNFQTVLDSFGPNRCRKYVLKSLRILGQRKYTTSNSERKKNIFRIKYKTFIYFGQISGVVYSRMQETVETQYGHSGSRSCAVCGKDQRTVRRSLSINMNISDIVIELQSATSLASIFLYSYAFFERY